MLDFIINSIIWTFALYGLFEMIKTIIYIYSCTKLKSDGIYLIVAVKNQENKIEGFLRSLLFRIIYGKEELVREVMIADLDSKDDTFNILKKMEKDEKIMKVGTWRECKEIIESIKES